MKNEGSPRARWKNRKNLLASTNKIQANFLLFTKRSSHTGNARLHCLYSSFRCLSDSITRCLFLSLHIPFLINVTMCSSVNRRCHNPPISNGNRTEWSPIRSVIIRVINKIGRPRSGSPICLITSMITDRIGRHEVLLPINHNFNKICSIIRLFFKSKHKKLKIFFC